MSEALQTGSQTPEPARVTPLHVFAAVLIGTPLELESARVAALVALARRDAAQAVASGRAPVEKRSLLPYVVLYRELRAEASRLPPREIPPTGTLRRRALVALSTLRHRQRAVLVLRYSAGLSPDEIAEVVGTSRRQAEEVVHAATGRLAGALGRPVDLASVFRIRKPPQRAAPRTGTSPPVRMPRAVVRTLLAPQPEEMEPRPPVQDIELPTVPTLPVASSFAVAPVVPRRRMSKKRLALAAAIVAMLSLAFVPVSARNARAPRAQQTQTATWQVAVPSVEPASVVSPPAVVFTVRWGDTLWSIAGRALGNPGRWTEIWTLNLGSVMRSGERFVDPDLIRPGWRLRLPPR